MSNDYGWICPRCKKVNAPWVKQCDCENEQLSNIDFNKEDFTLPQIIKGGGTPKVSFTYECCKNCSNNPLNNPHASGICHCTLPYFEQGITSNTSKDNKGIYTTTSNWPQYEWDLDGQLKVYFDCGKEEE